MSAGCVAGEAISAAGKTVRQLRQLGTRLWQLRLGPGGGEAGLRLQREMIELAEELEGFACQIRDQVAKVVIRL